MIVIDDTSYGYGQGKGYGYDTFLVRASLMIIILFLWYRSVFPCQA